MKNPVEDLCFRCDWCAKFKSENEAVSLGNGELVCFDCADGEGTPEFNENDLPPELGGDEEILECNIIDSLVENSLSSFLESYTIRKAGRRELKNWAKVYGISVRFWHPTFAIRNKIIKRILNENV